jgi:spore coat polysaccharide biosynthesis predicted glycosyltransferase SpsG
MGLPSVTVILAENQRAIAEALAKYKAGLLIDIPQVTEEITGLIEMYAGNVEMRHLLSQNAAQVCDGGGADRAVSAFAGEVV